MVDITHKSSTLRKATAQAIVKVSSQNTIDAIINKLVPKGDVFEMAKTAGLFAAKRTSDMIPDCHPLPIEFTAIRYDIQDLSIFIQVEVHTIYKTGVEVEAMHAASVVALTMYDMLKPIDKAIEINQIKLLVKTGGKSDYKDNFKRPITAGIIICSEPVLKGIKEDLAGQIIKKKLEKSGIEIKEYLIIEAEDSLPGKLLNWAGLGFDLILVSGGTGPTTKDRIPELIKPILDREIPGIGEAIRAYGQQRTPYAMISRSVAGMIGESLILGISGSSRGAEESMDAIFPAVLHIFKNFRS
jgi:cyclic pyranopterin monophosphate synthase